MKLLKKDIIFIVVILFIVSCSGDHNYEEAMAKNRERISEPEKFEDAAFLVEAKSVNMLQIELLELASTSGYASAVVTLGKRNLEIQNTLREDLRQIAKGKNIVLPASMSEQHQTLLKHVAESGRDEFDQRFITILKRVNEEITTQYTAMATNAYDPDIRAFAARKLDVLRTNAKDIATVEKELLKTSG